MAKVSVKVKDLTQKELDKLKIESKREDAEKRRDKIIELVKEHGRNWERIHKELGDKDRILSEVTGLSKSLRL